MNAKRQTIWLVSMLSLMVVLSAYYLFTEEAPSPAKEAVDHVRIEQTPKEDAKKSNKMSEIKVTEVYTDHEAGVDNKYKKNTTATQMEKDKDKSTTTTDFEDTDKDAEVKTKVEVQEDKEQAVLNKVEAEGVMKRSSIEKLQRERNDKVQQEMERLLTEINSSSGEKTASAYEKMTKLEDEEAKIANLETELQKQYSNAVIKQENDKYQVLVQKNDKMDKKEAAEIVGKLMKDLNITQDKVSVEHVIE